MRYLAEPLFHGDPVRPREGVGVWTLFGMEMLLHLQDMGFEISAWNMHAPRAGIVDPMPIVFEARKPQAQGGLERRRGWPPDRGP